MKRILIALGATSMLAAPVAVSAHPVYDSWGYRVQHNHGYQYGRYDDRRYRDYRRYDDYRGYDRRRYCRRSDGTIGTIVGGATGAIVGREIDSRGSRTVGTILGGAVGAIVGRELSRGRVRCR